METTMSIPSVLAALALAASAALPWGTANAQTPLGVGQRLGPQQVEALGTLPIVQIGDKHYRVAQTSTTHAGLPQTLLVDADGLVGQSFHEVVIGGLSPQTAREKAAVALAQAVEVKPYDRLKLTVARYATIEQAAKALAQLRAALPDAEVSLPVATSVPRPQ